MSDERDIGGRTPEVLDDLPIDGPYPSIWMLDDRPGMWIVVGTDDDGRPEALDLGRARGSFRRLRPPGRAAVAGGRLRERVRPCYTDDPQLLDRVEGVIRGAGRRSSETVG